MTLLVQICIVIATVGLLLMEAAVIWALLHARRVTLDLTRLTDSMERALVRLDRLADSSHDLLVSIQTVVSPLRRDLHDD